MQLRYKYTMFWGRETKEFSNIDEDTGDRCDKPENTHIGPAFLSVGFTKTGTTWLYHNLIKHPEVTLPHIKEIHYFWEKNFVKGTADKDLMFGKNFRHRRIRNQFSERLKDYMSKPELILSQKILWDFRYFVFPRNDAWFRNLYKTKNGLMTGNISPLHIFLPEDRIEKISRLYPGIKVLIFLRDPVERIWSTAKMKYFRLSSRHYDQVPLDGLIDLLEYQHKIAPDYIEIIERWEKYIPKENVGVFFFDKLTEDPLGFMQDVCEFLKLDYSKFPYRIVGSIQEKVNVSKEGDIPVQCAVRGAMLYTDCIRNLCNRYEPYPQRWLEKNLALLENKKTENQED